jgi:NAD(P)-dependent dehydrogenase (short-subunit alcohol dehydrogenase family)
LIDLAGRVAIVTGAGRGLGRSYAQLLAAHGASVVVNDLGTDVRGAGRDRAPATSVAAAINDAGGSAVASTHDVGSPSEGAALVALACEAFGGVDILVLNAGIVASTPFGSTEADVVQRSIGTNLLCLWYVGQPAWRQMLARGRGRMVLTSSAALYGHPFSSPYAAAKAGMAAAARSLAQEAMELGVDIRVNAIVPSAATRTGRASQRDRWGELLRPREVAPLVVCLAADDCPVNGEVLHAGGTQIARAVWGQTRGWARGEPGLSVEEVRARLAGIASETDIAIPRNTNHSTDLSYTRVTGRADALPAEDLIGGIMADE